MHACFQPIHAVLTSQDLSFDAKFSQSQSRETLPFRSEPKLRGVLSSLFLGMTPVPEKAV